jgi:hypothetical protein
MHSRPVTETLWVSRPTHLELERFTHFIVGTKPVLHFLLHGVLKGAPYFVKGGVKYLVRREVSEPLRRERLDHILGSL